ncbi:MAG: serine/threonine-protein kinase, partial [Gammaproteobacteria bacterium]
MDIPGYNIQREIGRGGMAIAYLATQESLEREVVLKVLDITSSVNNEILIERFLAEGRIVAALNHPNIITIYDIGIADNSLYISMEYVEGGDLKSRIGTPMEPVEALEFLAKISSGLDTAHKQGIVHRDVKPANILFRDDETPLLTDFGIAKQVNMDTDLTSTGMFVGSPSYTSPEQADGIEIDGRADIYSLGCIFHELLTGEKPYQSDTVIDILIQHKQAPIPTLPEDLKDFQRLLNMMLAKDRDSRFENTAILNGYIENLISNRNTIPAAVLNAEIKDAEDPGRKRKRRSLTILIGLIILSAIVFGALNYVEIRIKDDNINLDNIPVATSLSANSIIATNIMATPVTDNTLDNQGTIQSASKEVINALLWLGKQSLEEYRLTY